MKTKGDNVFLSGKEVLVMKYIQGTKENLEKSIFVVLFLTPKMLRYPPKKLGYLNVLMKDLFF